MLKQHVKVNFASDDPFKESHFHDCFLTHLSKLLKSGLCNNIKLKVFVHLKSFCLNNLLSRFKEVHLF